MKIESRFVRLSLPPAAGIQLETTRTEGLRVFRTGDCVQLARPESEYLVAQSLAVPVAEEEPDLAEGTEAELGVSQPKAKSK